MKDHRFFALLLAVIGIMSGLCLKEVQTIAVSAQGANIQSVFFADDPIGRTANGRL